MIINDNNSILSSVWKKNVYEIKDSFLWSKEYKLITPNEHHVKGLSTFGHWEYRTAAKTSEIHYHKNIYEFHCMVRGQRMFQFEEDGLLNNCIFTGNQVAVTFPYQIHGYQESFAQPYEFYSFQIDVSNQDELLGLNSDYSHQLINELCEMRKKMYDNHNHVLHFGSTHLSMLRSAFNLFSTLDESTIHTGVQFLTCFLFSLKYLSLVENKKEYDSHILDAVKYVKKNIGATLSVPLLADVSGYSPSYFKAKFKEETGMTAADYINFIRLEEAKDKLCSSNISISKISETLGFSSPSYFCSSFKRQTSYSPKEYREIHAIDENEND